MLLPVLATFALQSIPDHPPEDPTRKIRNWEQQLGGSAYTAAMKLTGMGGRPTQIEAGSNIWTRTGPFGGIGNGDSGRVSALQMIDIAGTTWIYIGASGGGLYRSQLSTQGVWEELGATLPNPSVRGLSISPTNHNDIVVGTGDWMRHRGAGIYRTLDGGQSWDLGLTPISNLEHTFRIERSLSQPSTLVAATDRGLLRSEDGGTNWSLASGPGGGPITELVGDLVRHPSQPGRMFSIVQNVGVLESLDDGATWSSLTDSDFPAAAGWGRGVIATSYLNPNVLVVAHEKNKSLQGVFRSTDTGTTWDDVTPSLSDGYNDQIFHALCVTVRPTDPDEILLGTVGIARSYWDSNAGQLAWLIGPPASGIKEGHSDYLQLHFDPLTGADKLWQASDGGLYLYDFQDPGTVTPFQGNGTTGLAISQIDHLDADRTFISIGLQDNGVLRSVDSGSSWDQQKSQDGGDQRIIDPVQWNYWFGHISGGPWNFWRSVYNQTPEQVPLPPSGLINSIHHVPSAGKIWASDKLSVWSASATAPFSDWASLWSQEVATGIHPDPNYQIASLACSPLLDETLFIHYRKSPDFTVGRKVGGSWDFNLIPGVGGIDWPVRRVTPSRRWPGECWIAMRGESGDPKVGHVMNYGEDPATDYEDLTNNLSSLSNVYVVVPHPFDPLTLYAGTDIGVFRSLDGGQNWVPFQDGLPCCQAKDMVFVEDDSLAGNHVLRIATYGLGTWERVIPAPPILYVDATSTAPLEDGTFEHPYTQVDSAVNAAPQGAVVAIRSSAYAAPLITNKQVHLVTYIGSSFVY